MCDSQCDVCYARAVSLADTKGTLDIPPYVRVVEFLVGWPLWHKTVRIYAQKIVHEFTSAYSCEPRWEVWHEKSDQFQGADPATLERISDAIVMIVPRELRFARAEELDTASVVERAIKVNGHLVGGLPAAMAISFPSGIRHIARQLTTHVDTIKVSGTEAVLNWTGGSERATDSLEDMVCAAIVSNQVSATVEKVLRVEVSTTCVPLPLCCYMCAACAATCVPRKSHHRPCRKVVRVSTLSTAYTPRCIEHSVRSCARACR